MCEVTGSSRSYVITDGAQKELIKPFYTFTDCVCSLLCDIGPWTRSHPSSLHFHTSTLLGTLSISDDTAGTYLVISDNIISCVMRLPGLYACLLGNSVFGVWVERDETDQMCVDIKETHVGSVYRQWNVCLFNLDAIQLVIKVAMNMGNNGLHDLLISCWIKLGIGGDDGMEITTWDGDAPGGYIRLGCPDFHIVHLLW